MVVVWRGFGFLVPIIGIAAWMGSVFAINAVFGKGYYGDNDWPMYCTVGLLCVALGAFGYLLNHRMRKDIEDPETGAIIGKPPSHSFFFVPIEYWAILVPVIVIWSQVSAAKHDAADASYLEAPIKGDVYVTDFTQTFDDIDPKHKWGLMKVVRVSGQTVHVKIGTMGYGVSISAAQAVTEGEDRAPNYYLDETLSLGRAELPELKATGVISEVVRAVGGGSVALAD